MSTIMGDARRADIEVVLAVDDPAETRDLLGRLRSDDDLRGVTSRLERGAAAPEELGTADEVLRVLLDPELAAALAGALTTWLTTRRRAVTLRVRRADRELTLEAGNTKDAAKLLDQAREFLSDDDGPEDRPED